MHYVLALIMSLSLISTLVAQQEYPLDQELTSAFGGDSSSIEMKCKVSKVGDVYVYMYSIKNNGKSAVKVKWDLISQAMYFGNTIDLMLDLEPEENAVFTLQHPDPPIATRGKVTSFYLTSNEKVVKLVTNTPDLPKNMKIEISKKTLYNSSSGSGHGALPKSFIILNYRR